MSPAQAVDANDVWVQCSGARLLHTVMQRGGTAQRALLDGGALAALSRALDAPPEKARKPNGFGFDEGQMRQKLARPSGHQGRRGLRAAGG